MRINIDNHTITIGNNLKYLGIIFDKRMSFKEHVHYTCNKTSKLITALTKIMPNIYGPSEVKRRLLMSTSQCILRYAIPVWVDTLTVTSYRNLIEKTYRRAKLRTIQEYRTLSKEAIDVLAGTLPITIELRLAASRFNNGYIRNNKETIKQQKMFMEKWQKEIWCKQTN